MASAGGGRREQLRRRSHSEHETPHFSRTMIPELLRLGKLDIPKAFFRSYGNDLSNRVLLRVPSGETWTVDLEKDHLRIQFGRGWKNFVEHFSILPDYSVDFGFEGNSTFHTVIFDQTGFEINYPIRCSCHNTVNIKTEVPTPEEEDAPNQDVYDDADLAAFMSEMEADGDHEALGSAPAPAPARPGTTRSGTTNSQEAPAMASSFVSDNPFFQAEVGRPDMTCLWISRNMMERCNLKTGPNPVTLEHLDRLWSMNVIGYESSGRGSLHNGWRAFMRDISLQVGDLCIFEVIASNHFKVVTLRD